MKSGKNVRNTIIAVAAAISAIVQNLLVSLIEDNLSKFAVTNGINGELVESTSNVVKVLLYIIVFLACMWLLQLLMKVKWVRTVVFNEKIIDGKWFECIYSDERKSEIKSYRITDIYFDDNSGDFVYAGTTYSIDNYQSISKFRSTCSSLTFENKRNSATLNYAYTLEGEAPTGHGDGSTDFTFEKKGNHGSGWYYESDGTKYIVEATLITDRWILKRLDRTGNELTNAIRELAEKYKNSVSQDEMIKDMYASDPDTFDKFIKKEDSKGNLRKELSRFDFKDKIVLDMGAGTGRFSKYVVKDVGRLICSDSSKHMVDHMKKNFVKKYSRKVEVVHCDHMALPALTVSWKGKVDYIIAGYAIGPYFSDNLLSREQKEALFKCILDMAKSILAENGTMIIVEVCDIGNEGLLSFDAGLNQLYELLEGHDFERVDVDTSFRFLDRDNAVKVIGSFWGNEAVRRIERLGAEWILKEKSGVWTKTFNTEQ